MSIDPGDIEYDAQLEEGELLEAEMTDGLVGYTESLMVRQLHQLLALTWDGKLISKDMTAQLRERGYAKRNTMGQNVITAAGLDLISMLEILEEMPFKYGLCDRDLYDIQRALCFVKRTIPIPDEEPKGHSALCAFRASPAAQCSCWFERDPAGNT